MKGISIITGVLIIMFLSGCGTFTKMRYSRGFKSNIEFNFGKKEGQNEPQTAAKAVKKQHPGKENTVEKNSQVDATASEEYTPPSIQPDSKSERNTSIARIKALKIKQWPFVPQDNKKTDLKTESRPIDPTSAVAGVLFYAGIILWIISNYAFYVPLIPLIASLFIIIGFILAIVGTGKIKRSNHEYSGMGLDISIIVLFGLIVLSYLLIIAFLLAII